MYVKQVLLLCSNPQANAHLKTWNTQSNGNLIASPSGTDARNKADFVMPMQDKMKLQKGPGGAAGGDPRTLVSNLDINPGDVVATEVVQTNSGTGGNENGKPNVQAKESVVSETSPDEDKSDNELKNETGTIRNVNMLIEYNMSSPMLSEDKKTSAANIAKPSEDVPLAIAYEKSGEILQDSSKAMNVNSKSMNTESKLLTEVEKENNPESQYMIANLRSAEEGTSISHNLTSEIKTSGLQGVENEESVAITCKPNSFANEGISSVGNIGVGRESLSDIDSYQTIQNDGTTSMSVMEWRNDEVSTAVPIQNNEAYSNQFRPHKGSEVTDTVDNTEGEFDPLWSTLDQNESQDGDGPPKNTFSVSLYSRAAEEDEPQSPLDKSVKGMEPRYSVQGHGLPYYANNPAGSAYMRPRREDISHMCVVPCSPVNYIVEPYQYGYYGDTADHSHVTGVHLPPLQLPPLHLPHMQLPPVHFPDLHDSSTAFSSVSVDGHGGHPSANEIQQNHNYVVTSNAYASASPGAHNFGSTSHSYAKDPLSHLEYSLATPQEYVQTSLVLKAPHPYIHPSIHPSIHQAEKENTNLHKPVYF
jgi:hypothetical protein